MFLIIMGTGAFAATVSDLKFEKDDSAKYIYCNNPEFIYRENLADNSNENPKFLMSNENMGVGKYTLFASHINHTEIGDGTRWGVVAPGFDIEVDVLFEAKEDAVLKITAAGFEVPENFKYYLNGREYTNEEKWGCFNAWASYLGEVISEKDSGKKYYPTEFETVEISLKKGEKTWLGKYIKNYREVPFYRPVHIMTDFEIEKGQADICVAAVKSTGTLNDRSRVSEKAEFGHYIFEHQHKGVSDFKNEVTAELNFKIDDTDLNETLLPVKVVNQYAPEGANVNIWYTNLNPRSDPWNKFNVAETGMLSFKYKDPAKLKLYGKNVSESEKNDIWLIDDTHSDRAEFEKGMPFDKKGDFIPNYELEVSNKEDYAASLGNFGVLQTYKISIENDGERDRFVNYKLNTGSDNLIILRDENKNIMENYPLTKGYCKVKEKDILACVKLPAKKTTTFYLTVILTTNYAGGMENCLEITDDANPVRVYEENYSKNLKDIKYTGREYLKWDNEDILISRDLVNWERKTLNDATKAIFKGNQSNFKFVRTNEGYLAKNSIYDGVTYYSVGNFYKTVYLLDNDFNLIKEKKFSNYVKDISYGSGTYFIDSGTKYYSKDFEEFKPFDNSFDMPVGNLGNITLAMKNGEGYLSTDGINFSKINYFGTKPKYFDSLGNIFYFAEGKDIYYSENGVYYKKAVSDEEIFKVGFKNNAILINDNIEIPVKLEKSCIVSFKGEILGFENIPYVNEKGVLMIPLRESAKKIGADLVWDGEKAVLNYKDAVKNFEAGEENIIKEGVLYTPGRAFFENIGFNVEYSEGIVYVK